MVIVRDLSGVATFRDHWEFLSSFETRRVIPDFDDVLRSLREARTFALIAEIENETPRCLACFVQAEIACDFAIGKRHLWTTTTDQIYLVGEVVLGKLDIETWRKFLRELDRICKFEFINLGEIPVDSGLYGSATMRSVRYRASSWSAADNVRWRANLPQQFDDYIASLRPKTRQMVRQALRKSQNVRSFERITATHQIDEFLSVAIAINRQTYQWKLGLRLKNDKAERSEYVRLAQRGQLRCYILRINGDPCAFIRGVLVRNMFLYQASGFLPEFGKWSPGKIALTLAIKDLLESDGCRVFDFGDVGDHTGYKSRFGNASTPSHRILISKRLSLRPTLMTMAQRVLLGFKTTSKWLLANEKLRRSIRRFVRA